MARCRFGALPDGEYSLSGLVRALDNACVLEEGHAGPHQTVAGTVVEQSQEERDVVLDAARWRWFRAHWYAIVFYTSKDHSVPAAKCDRIDLREPGWSGDADSLDKAIDEAMRNG